MGDEHGPTAAGNAAARYAEAMERCQRERPELWSRLETFEIKAVDEFLPPPRLGDSHNGARTGTWLPIWNFNLN